MKVLHVIESLDPKYGGPSLSCPSLAAAQAMHCIEVGIVTYGMDFQRFASLELPGQEKLVLHSLAPGRLERITLRKARNFIGEELHNYSIVHIHGLWGRLGSLVAKSAMEKGIPYIVAPRGMLDPWSLAQKKYKKQLALKIQWKRILDNAKFIHALNDDEANFISTLGLLSPTVISPNGMFIEKFGKLDLLAPPLLINKYGSYILFLSRLHHKKGLDYLISAYREYLHQGGESALVIAGPDEGGKAFLEKSIMQSRLQGRVHLLGPVYGREKYGLLKSAKVFCLPSRQEGFSMAILEACASGVPVVISQECHFPDVGWHNAGKIVKLDPLEIAQALLFYTENASCAGLNGQELVKNSYRWEVIASDLIRKYSEAQIS